MTQDVSHFFFVSPKALIESLPNEVKDLKQI
jgi:hypothetical protein